MVSHCYLLALGCICHHIAAETGEMGEVGRLVALLHVAGSSFCSSSSLLLEKLHRTRPEKRRVVLVAVVCSMW